MKVAILHHDLEPTEKKLYELLLERGVDVNLLDVRKVKIEDFSDVDLVLNRVYASVANRDYSGVEKVLELLKQLEENGVVCLNSCRTSLFDYSKFDSYKLMKENGVPTPDSLFIRDFSEIGVIVKEAVGKFSFPMIIKRDTGGRGKDICRVNDQKELNSKLVTKFDLAKKEKYCGGFIVQEFLVASERYDCRIGIIDGSFGFSYKRSLICSNSEDVWLASTSNGSVEQNYAVGEEVKEIALKASKLIGAEYNEIDMYFTDSGPVVVEHNPTPNYFIDDKDDLFRMEKFVDAIVMKLENIHEKNGISIRACS